MDHKESWTLKNWCFCTVVLRRLLRLLCTARRSNESILKETNPEYLLVGLMLKLKLQYVGHSMRKTTHFKRPWRWERLKAGGEGYDRGWDGWMATPTQWTWVWAALGDGEGQGSLVCCSPWDAKSWTQLNDWTTKNVLIEAILSSGAVQKQAPWLLPVGCR